MNKPWDLLEVREKEEREEAQFLGFCFRVRRDKRNGEVRAFSNPRVWLLLPTTCKRRRLVLRLET